MGLLTATGMHITYPSGFALGPITLDVAAGATIGVMGRNGAGKSTFFEGITGQRELSGGEIYIDSQKVSPKSPESKKHLGYLPQESSLPRWMTAQELALFVGQIYGVIDPATTARSALEKWGCNAFATRPIAQCSYGMQKRIGLALALLHDPKLLILDEAYSGLDIDHIRTLDGVLRNRRERKLVTILATHNSHEAAQYCDRLLLMKSGTMTELESWSAGTLAERMRLVDTHL